MAQEEKEILGRKFRMVDRGLDESEVYSFIESLTNQYGNFAQKLSQIDAVVSKLAEQYGDLSKKLDVGGSPASRANGHAPEVNGNKPAGKDILAGSTNGHKAELDGDMEYLGSLARFAERTIVEAAKRAKSVESEIEWKARARAAEIIERAKEQAGSGGGGVASGGGTAAGAGLEASARERAEEIIAAAQRKAQELIKIAESRAGTAGPSTEAHDTLKEAKAKVEEGAQRFREELEDLLASAKNKKLGEEEVKDAFEKVQKSLKSLSRALDKSAAGTAEKEVEAPEHSKAKAAPVEEETEEAVAEEPQEAEAEKVVEEPQDKAHGEEEGGKRDAEMFEGTVELVLPPPVGLDRMLQLHKSLKHTPNIDVLNMGGSVDKGITIRVLMETPIPLIEVISELPEIKEAREEIPEGGMAGARGEHSIRKVLITTW